MICAITIKINKVFIDQSGGCINTKIDVVINSILHFTNYFGKDHSMKYLLYVSITNDEFKTKKIPQKIVNASLGSYRFL